MPDLLRGIKQFVQRQQDAYIKRLVKKESSGQSNWRDTYTIKLLFHLVSHSALAHIWREYLTAKRWFDDGVEPTQCLGIIGARFGIPYSHQIHGVLRDGAQVNLAHVYEHHWLRRMVGLSADQIRAFQESKPNKVTRYRNKNGRQLIDRYESAPNGFTATGRTRSHDEPAPRRIASQRRRGLTNADLEAQVR